MTLTTAILRDLSLESNDSHQRKDKCDSSTVYGTYLTYSPEQPSPVKKSEKLGFVGAVM